jgi:hypothetical protein
MFTQKTSVEPTELEIAIERLLIDMKMIDTDSDEYSKMVDQVVKLHTLKETEKSESMSLDTKATLIANLVGILLILNHERAGIVTSKALSFVTKLR